MTLMTLTYVSSMSMNILMSVLELLSFSYKLSFSYFDVYKLLSLVGFVVEFYLLFEIIYLTREYIKIKDGTNMRLPNLKEEIEIGFWEIL